MRLPVARTDYLLCNNKAPNRVAEGFSPTTPCIQLRTWLTNEPDLTLIELCDKYEAHFNITVGKSS